MDYEGNEWVKLAQNRDHWPAVTKNAINLKISTKTGWATRWRSWLRHCATSRNVASSIPNGIIGICHCNNPSSHNMSLGLTHPLTEMSTMNISWGVKAAGA
jgi:hypothetical protein